MGKIDLTINKAGLENNIRKAKENNIIILFRNRYTVVIYALKSTLELS